MDHRVIRASGNPDPGSESAEPAQEINLTASREKPAGVQYDVFVSHRGTEFKQTLVQWIKEGFGSRSLLFIDNVSMDPASGGIGWQEILDALRTAKIVLIILSPGFQESAYCLEELRVATAEKLDDVRILCYGIEPGHINEQALQMASKEPPFGDHKTPEDSLDKWKVALKKAGQITSWTYTKDRQSEPDIVRDVVSGILRCLPPTPQDWESGKVGIREHVQDVLKEHPAGGRPVILGLWGMGGVGKTTLGLGLFGYLSRDFLHVCIVDDFCEEVKRCGIIQVQQCMLKDLFHRTEQNLHTKGEGQIKLRKGLEGKKVLMFLDNVELGDLKNVVGDCNSLWPRLGEGSFVIIASKNRRALADADCVIWHVECLPHDSSIELFRLFAKAIPEDVNDALVVAIVEKCCGLPLCLKVMGAYLNSLKSKALWKAAFQELETAGTLEADDENLFAHLRISYDGLSTRQSTGMQRAKEMFLDIACLMIGRTEAFAMEVWKRRGWNTSELYLKTLQERCLVTIEERRSLATLEGRESTDGNDRLFRMHDLIRDMGRGIEIDDLSGVQKSLIDRHRAWLLADVNPNQSFSVSMQGHAESFSPLSKLPILTVDFRAFAMMPNAQMFSSLQVLDLSGCKSLMELFEDVGNLSNLQTLILEGCSSLTGLPDGFGDLSSLEILNLHACTTLMGLPNDFGNLSNLVDLNLSGCESLAGLPDAFGDLSNLQNLDLAWCHTLEELPDGFTQLSSLLNLNLSMCRCLTKLPDGFENFVRLQSLDLVGCGRLAGVPNGFGGISSLRTLNVKGCCNELEFLKEVSASLPQCRIVGLSS